MGDKVSFFYYDQVPEHSADRFGMKALNMAHCHRHGFLIPNGVILPTEIFFAYMREEPLDLLFEEIAERFGSAKMLIVRSSAIEEDQQDTSFAGQYLSLICENKPQDIKKACEACWESGFSENVEAYRRAFAQTKEPAGRAVALLVQTVINASSAGVCFSKDPQNKNKDVCIINAVHGLGETLVSGEVICDHYEFDIKRGKTVYSCVGRQTHWRCPVGPSILDAVPVDLQGKTVLGEEQVAEIARMAEKVTGLFHMPLDIEWAYEGNQLFLLQARPITSGRKKKTFQLWTRDNVADVIPDAVTPLTWSLVKKAVNDGYARAVRCLGFSAGEISLFEVFDGRAYFNSGAFQEIFMNLSENKKSPASLLKKAGSYFFSLLVLPTDVAGVKRTFVKRLNQCLKGSGVVRIKRLKNYLEEVMALHIRVALMMQLGILIVRRLIKRKLGADAENRVIDGLLTGLNEIESTDSAKALRELAYIIKDNRILKDEIISSAESCVPAVLKRHGGVYYEKWERFFEKFGHQSLKEFEIYFPRWSEDAGFVVTALKQYIREDTGENEQEKSLSRVKKRIQAAELVLNSVSPLWRMPLKFYINHVQQCSIWREMIKQKLVMIMAEMRKQSLALAGQIKLEPADSVFFLSLDELVVINGELVISSGLTEQLAIRKTEWQAWEKEKPFRQIYVYEDGKKVKIPYLTGKGECLKGLGLSSGEYSGTAKVILTREQMASFNKGDILVTCSTNPSWTPLFALAGAIVTDMGNYLSHGAIVARELGIPAVGNLFDATKRIRNGQRLYVDGEQGIVRILEEGQDGRT